MNLFPLIQKRAREKTAKKLKFEKIEKNFRKMDQRPRSSIVIDDKEEIQKKKI